MQKRFLGLTLLFAFAGSGYLVNRAGLEGLTYFIDAGYWAIQIWYIRHFYRNNVKIKTLLASLCLIISLIASFIFIAGLPVPDVWGAWRSLSAIILVILLLGDDDGGGGNYIDDKLFSSEELYAQRN